jgi:ribosomal protein S18 acetylase RimI-like enzyme/nitroimidazol reductase NimA-like FMN-containing flavoprotein (pyridoxamine 5'-phosphate oxidase superfamily)
MERERALELLSRAEVVRVATTTPAGEPVLRTLNHAVVRDRICFHGAKAGEKAQSLGRRAVVAADAVIAVIPSYFIDPERACPATTFYESVQVHGVLETVAEPELKAEALAALMRKHQPEGGYTAIDASSPLYAGAVRGVSVFAVSLENVSGKLKLGQNRSAAELAQIVEGLWQRGARGDVEAVQRIFEANPSVPRPPRFVHAEFDLEPALDVQAQSEAVGLLASEYWNRTTRADRIARAQLGSTAWVGARDRAGALVATARALSDGAKHAFIADVAVRADLRRSGLGSRLVELLLDHPALRDASLLRLGTADAQGFYRRFGFVDQAEVGFGFASTTMLLVRSEARG